jgi:hypothetical protein
MMPFAKREQSYYFYVELIVENRLTVLLYCCAMRRPRVDRQLQRSPPTSENELSKSGKLEIGKFDCIRQVS